MNAHGSLSVIRSKHLGRRWAVRRRSLGGAAAGR